MKWTYAIQQKTKVALLLTIILVLVLVKSIVDRRHVAQLGDSFSAVYEDRLLAESYIYKLNNEFSQKKFLIDNFKKEDNKDALNYKLQLHNTLLSGLIADYEKTKLTPAEDIRFKASKKNFAQNIVQESEYIQQLQSDSSNTVSKEALDKSIYMVMDDLRQLSNIQITEGKRMTDDSKKIVAGSNVLSYFEAGLLFAISVLIIGLILASKSMRPKQPQQHELN